jgi:glycerol kinase
MPHLLALDQGTSSSRSIVFNEQGQVIATAQQEFRQIYPKPGWVEHDPQEIWRTQLDTARQVLSQAGLRAQDIAAIGVTNQRETTVLWNRRTGEPLGNAIVWQDRRTEPLCASLRQQGLEPVVNAKTGLRIDAYFSATKLAWMLRHVPGARAMAERGELAFGTVDSWLIWQLTGGQAHVTDVSNAARTMLFDVQKNRFDEELLRALDIPSDVLPQVQPSSSHFGLTSAELLGGAIPIGGVAGDQQAALFGQAPHRPHSAMARRSSPWKAACSLAGPWFSGFAMDCTRSSPARRYRPWRRVSWIPAACSSYRPSPAWAHRTGRLMHGAPSWG